MRVMSPDPGPDVLVNDADGVAETPQGRDDRSAGDERPSRRRFFALGVSLAAASVAGARTTVAQQAAPAPKKQSAVRQMVRKLMSQPPSQGFDPFVKKNPAAQKGWDSALTTLVRRITNGVTEDEVKLAQKLGFNGYLNYHLNFAKIDDSAASTFVAQNYPLISQTGDELYRLAQDLPFTQLREATLYRAAFSKRQLYERMVEFWSDHFNISYREVNYLKVLDDREVVRKHALGKFPNLLRASAHSPAMLEYLDNTRNRGRNPNQNYAREIMELHTLGVDGGYTQQDVAELSRCLTGWTLAGRGNFYFDPSGHDFTEKTVLGQRIAAMPSSAGAAGKQDGDVMIEFLVRHPQTARYIAKKMLFWLLRYDPTDAQISAVASVYTKTQGDIPAMVRAILTPANLTAAPPKFKRPYTYMLSALRATKPNVTKVSQLAGRYLTTLGQPMFAWETPDGYPDRADYWAGGVLERWNFATYITTTSSEIQMDLNRFVAVNTPDGVADAIGREIFGGEIPTRLRGQLMTYLQAQPLTQSRAREAVALALGSSTFQWI
jgi:uncharacterized protein (DUF1800 family)